MSVTSCFIHRKNWPARYSWNIVETPSNIQTNNQDWFGSVFVICLALCVVFFVPCCHNSFCVLVIIKYVQLCCIVDYNIYSVSMCGLLSIGINFSPVHFYTRYQNPLPPPHHLTVLFPLLLLNFTDLVIFHMHQFYTIFSWYYLKIKPHRLCDD